MDWPQLGATALRAIGVYAFVLVIIRLLGKRTIGNFTAFDLLVALMLGEMVDEIIYGDVSAAQGAVALVTIAVAQYANSWLSYGGHGLDRVLEGTPTEIVRDGQLQRRGMRLERMNEKDVLSELRLQGIQDVREVKLALVENDGQVSVLREDWAEPAQKADLVARADEQRRQTLQGVAHGTAPEPGAR
jgi:uncharacterized membrane protein YcaP (DUF421 family)